MVVARIRVTASTVLGAFRERLFVVSLDRLDAGVSEDRKDPVRVGTERAEIAQRVHRIGAPVVRGLAGGLDRPRVAVDAAEEREPPHVRHVTPYSWQVKQD